MKKILLQIGAVLLLQLVAIGSTTAQVENVQTKVEKFAWKNGNLFISMKVDMSDVTVFSPQGVEYTPILSISDNDIILPSVLLMGRESHKKYIRSLALMSRDERKNTPQPYIVVKDFSDDSKIVNYEYVFSCNEPIVGCKLELSNLLFGCGEATSSDVVYLAKIDPKIIPFVPCVAYVDLDNKFVGTAEVADNFGIYFRFDRHNIDPSYMDNAESLANVKSFMDEIHSVGDTTIAKIVIGGFSSIEGPYKYNTALSLKRATAIYDYIFKGSKIDPSIIELYNGTENWAELREMVVASDMASKSAVLDIIDSTPIESRDSKLMRLNSGSAYRYIRDNFFVELRRSSFVKVFRLYDDKNGRVINKAVDYINAKEYDKALELLLTVSSDERSHNAIGVCYMMLDDLDSAKSYLEKVAHQGNDAEKNLDQIDERDSIHPRK